MEKLELEFEGTIYVRDDKGVWTSQAEPTKKLKNKLVNKLEKALKNPPAPQADKKDRYGLVSKFLVNVPTPFGSDSTLPCVGREDHSGKKPVWIPDVEASTCVVSQVGFSFNWRPEGAKRRRTDHFLFGVDIFDNGEQWEFSEDLQRVLNEYGPLQAAYDALSDEEKKGRKNPYGVFNLKVETTDALGKGTISMTKEQIFSYQESPVENKKAFTKKNYVAAGEGYSEFWSVETTFQTK